MGMLNWAEANWFTLLQSAGIIGGLLFTGVALNRDTKTRRIANLLTITQHHREIWSELYRRPDLARVADGGADVLHKPMTIEEELFLRLLILHLASTFQAMRQGVFLQPEGVKKDIQAFFSLPLPRQCWESLRPWQDADFVRFIEECLGESGDAQIDYRL